MHDSETTAERKDRFYRLRAKLIRRVRAGDDFRLLRAQLETAAIISPLSGVEQAIALNHFDEVVAIHEQLDKSLKTRS